MNITKSKLNLFTLLFSIKSLIFNILVGTILSVIILNPSKVLANNKTCAVASVAKYNTNIDSVLGEKSSHIRLAIAELLSKYSSANKGSMQIEQNVQVLLNAIVSGRLTEEQINGLNEYQDLFENIVKQSVLSSRDQLTPVQQKIPAPKLVSEILVPAVTVPVTGESGLAGFFKRLNPFKQFYKKSQLKKKYGPVIPFIHVDQIVTQIKVFNEADRLEVLKYTLESVDMLSPREVVQLILAVPIESQFNAFNFLVAKIIGRFDFYSISILSDISTNFSANVLLKILAHSGSHWPLGTILELVKDKRDVSSNNFGESLKTTFGIKAVEEYIHSINEIELREAELLLSLALHNTENQVEANNIYTQMIEKLFHAEDKQKLEMFFKKGKIKIKANLITNPESESEFDMADNVFEHYKKGANSFFKGAGEESLNKVKNAIEYRIQSGQIDTAEKFIKDFKLPPQIGNWLFWNAMASLWDAHLQDFVALNPTISEYQIAVKEVPKFELAIKLVKLRLQSNKITKPKDIIDTLNIKRGSSDLEGLNANLQYKLAISYLWNQNARKFVELNPTQQEFETAKEHTETISDLLALMDARLKFGNLKSQDEIEATFNIPWLVPTEEQVQNVTQFKQAYYTNSPFVLQIQPVIHRPNEAVKSTTNRGPM